MPKRATSIRIPGDLKEELERRAREAGLPAAALYERYLDEGLRREAHPLIAFRDSAGGRRAVLVGTRLYVAQVIDTIEDAAGDSDARIAEAAEYLALPLGHVRACVSYYAAHKDGIDAERQRAAAAAERAREAWQREQALFS